MRLDEAKYWDHVAVTVKGRDIGELNDNIWKRSEIVSRILSHRPIHARILEIGVGQGLGAAAVNLVTLGNIHYTGTDVSPSFCGFVQRRWKLDVVNTDVLNLPDGPFDMVWAFDTLEHVRPEDRAKGYAEINRVLARPGVVLLNVPLNESTHEEGFDWGYTEADVNELAQVCGAKVQTEKYDIEEVGRSYLWVEMNR
jgi:SAM-dependent methyltransferase